MATDSKFRPQEPKVAASARAKKGTSPDDNRFLVVTGRAGQMLLLGVVVNLAGQLAVVWLPSATSDGAAFYVSMMTALPEKLIAHLAGFDATEGKEKFHVQRSSITLLPAGKTFRLEFLKEVSG